MKMFGSQVRKEKNSSFYKSFGENWVTINTQINLELYFMSHIRGKKQNESNMEMSNFNKGMRDSCKMNDPSFILQSQDDLITESHFLILDPLDIFEHFAGVHFHLKPSKLWLK